MGSKIRAVSREINLQHCRETQPHFIFSAAAAAAAGAGTVLTQPPSEISLYTAYTRSHK